MILGISWGHSGRTCNGRYYQWYMCFLLVCPVCPKISQIHKNNTNFMRMIMTIFSGFWRHLVFKQTHIAASTNRWLNLIYIIWVKTCKDQDMADTCFFFLQRKLNSSPQNGTFSVRWERNKLPKYIRSAQKWWQLRPFTWWCSDHRRGWDGENGENGMRWLWGIHMGSSNHEKSLPRLTIYWGFHGDIYGDMSNPQRYGMGPWDLT